MQLSLAIIPHKVENTLIHQRAVDGYVNATAMCKAAGKFFGNYRQNASTEAFLAELSSVIGIPITALVVTIQGGKNPELQGTWVHPKVAIHLGQWCSPKFAVAVSEWVHDWMTGKVKAELPAHIARYMVNRAEIPSTHFSMLNEIIFALVGPLEADGYTLPEKMIPDISTGKMFSQFLRDKGIDVDGLPSYSHSYLDGRKVPARLYPNEHLADFRHYFHTVWLPQKAVGYFKERDPDALPFLANVLPAPSKPLPKDKK